MLGSGVPATKETGGFGFGSALAAGQPAAMTGQGFAHGLSVSGERLGLRSFSVLPFASNIRLESIFMTCVVCLRLQMEELG